MAWSRQAFSTLMCRISGLLPDGASTQVKVEVSYDRRRYLDAYDNHCNPPDVMDRSCARRKPCCCASPSGYMRSDSGSESHTAIDPWGVRALISLQAARIFLTLRNPNEQILRALQIRPVESIFALLRVCAQRYACLRESKALRQMHDRRQTRSRAFTVAAM